MVMLRVVTQRYLGVPAHGGSFLARLINIDDGTNIKISHVTV